MNLIYYLLIALGFNIIMFIFAYKFKTDKLTDLSYALTFIFLILLGFITVESSKIKIILLIMIILWALRLGIFLFIRIGKMKKDKRFDDIRDNFFKFFSFWFFQGLTVWIILIPSLIFFNSQNKITLLSWIGFGIWFIGLTIETVADLQKYQFNQLNENNKKGLWISAGLWKYARHPNYFGEILLWIGVYIFTFASLKTIERLISILSPLFIAIMIIFITGLPKLEEYADKKWGKLKEYKEYKRKTSILIPWFQNRK